MKQYYKIKSILHSGSQGVRGTPKTDGYNLPRVNRIIELDDSNYFGTIRKGSFFIARYVKDANGKDYSYEHSIAFCSSKVVDWDYVYENVICVETENSIYELETVDME